MNLSEYMSLQAQLEDLYTDLERAKTDSEADGIQRKIDIIEIRVDEILNIDNDRYIEEEQEY